MTSLKEIEIRFRSWLLHFLAHLVKRGRPIPADIDFNRCKFLFVRQDRIGDVLVSTPLFYALKKHYTGAVVDFFLSENNHFVLENEPLVRKRWIYTKRFFHSIRLLMELRRERYDFVIDLMDNPSATSTVICSLAGGRWNVGLMKENEFVYDVTVPLLSRRDTHIVDRLVQLLKVFRIEIDREDFAIRYVVSAASQQFADRFFRENNMTGKVVLGVNISAGSEVRFWGIHNFHKMIEQLRRDEPHLPVLLLYTPSEKNRAEEIAEGFDEVVLSPQTHSFDEFAALIQRVHTLVTPDTSAVHLAAAFNIPSVVLYVQLNKDLRVWEPYETEAAIHVTDVDDLTTILPDEVYASVRKILRRAVASQRDQSKTEAVRSR